MVWDVILDSFGFGARVSDLCLSLYGEAFPCQHCARPCKKQEPVQSHARKEQYAPNLRSPLQQVRASPMQRKMPATGPGGWGRPPWARVWAVPPAVLPGTIEFLSRTT